MFTQLYNPNPQHTHGGARHQRLPNQDDGDANGGTTAENPENPVTATAVADGSSSTDAAGGSVTEASSVSSVVPEDGAGVGSSDEATEPDLVVRSGSDDPSVEDVPFPTPLPAFLSEQFEAEMELRRRRRCTCTLLIIFFLSKLWVEALVSRDPALMLFGAAGTAWAVRWIAARRESDEERDRRAEERIRGRAAEGADGTAVDGEGNAGDAVSGFDPDLGLMSFQAQLALAILESQRQMFENGGYGGNDRDESDAAPGVTGEAKDKWKKFQWEDEHKDDAPKQDIDLPIDLVRISSSTTIQRTLSNESNYGSVRSHNDDDEEIASDNPKPPSEKKLPTDGYEEPSCSICLCEYEKGDALVRLPCNHLFHESCLDAWTANHIRCPLCNLDLMDGFEADQQPQQEQHGHGSALNLNSPARRFLRANRRSQSRYLAFATAAAAMDDSVV